jgi:hypothetical protein
MVSEDPLNNIAKKYKNIKLSGFLSDLWGLNYPSYQLFEATFHSQFFLCFNFYFCQKTPRGLKTWEN